MQPRLARSQTEIVIAGVCGGLAEYFAIDPVIVRLIFVLLTLTSGLGVIVYPILWAAMPKGRSAAAGAIGFTYIPPETEEWRQQSPVLGQQTPEPLLREQMQQVHARAATHRAIPLSRYADDPPPEQDYNFDPLTGQPRQPSGPATRQTIDLRFDPTLASPDTQLATEENAPPPAYYIPPTPVARRRRGLHGFGYMLLVFGALALASQLGANLDIVFPILLVVAGLLLLRRR